ncbi:transposase [Microcystis aeruginosa]|uniref:transposase n=1 Tax=Microcystis aeruginosa TaxID=1126 RepID=UPI0037C8327D
MFPRLPINPPEGDITAYSDILGDRDSAGANSQLHNLSQRELAKRFRVALSFIQKLIKQWRETGNLNPRPHGGGQKLKLKSDEIILLGDLVQEKKDATLDELRKQIEEKTQTVVSNSTISRILKRLNLTQKKKLTR